MRHVPPPHLPAADLGLTDDELHALLWVTERLEDGRIADDEFDMQDETGRCIGALMDARLGYERPLSLLNWCRDHQLEKLFFPPSEERVINGETRTIIHPAWTCNRHSAARACRQFLATGAVDWDAAIDGRA